MKHVLKLCVYVLKIMKIKKVYKEFIK
jgi:hypothetical protein